MPKQQVILLKHGQEKEVPVPDRNNSVHGRDMHCMQEFFQLLRSMFDGKKGSEGL